MIARVYGLGFEVRNKLGQGQNQAALRAEQAGQGQNLEDTFWGSDANLRQGDQQVLNESAIAQAAHHASYFILVDVSQERKTMFTCKQGLLRSAVNTLSSLPEILR